MEGKTRKLLEQIKKSNFANYPISNALLTNETDYIKNNYFRHLALVLTQKGEVSENQRYLFSRLLVGANAESDIEEYLRQALDIEIEQYVEFMSQMREKELRYRFLLDATLITCCDAYDAEQQELLAAFMESLKMPLREAEFLCAISRSILEQDKEGYWGQIQENEDIVFRNFAQEYTREYAGEYLVSVNDEKFFLYFPEKKKITKKFLTSEGVRNGVINGFEEVRICNGVFDVTTEDLLIQGCKKVAIENCEFQGGEGGINLINNDKIKFSNCMFTDFRKRALRVTCHADAFIWVYNCCFEKCRMYDSHVDNWPAKGGVIWSDYACSFRLEGTIFRKCGVTNDYGYPSSAIILNQKANVKNCTFKDCWGDSYDRFSEKKKIIIDSPSRYRTLFAKGSIDEGNTITNSAEFGLK